MKANPSFWKYLALLLASMGITLSEAGLIGANATIPDILDNLVYSDLKPADLRWALIQAK